MSDELLSPAKRLLLGRMSLLALVVFLVLPGCASLDDWQRQKIYRPTPVASSAEWQRLLAQRPDVRAFTVPVPARSPGQGEHVTVLHLPAQPGQRSAVKVLFLHGTFRHAFQNLAKAEPMRQAGLDVFIPDYRGWGASSPIVPSEQSIHADAWAIWNALQTLQAKPPSVDGRPVRWVIYGHSMGSAVAAHLASRLRGAPGVCALVLESSFTSFADVADAGAGWLGRTASALGAERMASVDVIGLVSVPVWFMHGSQDKTIPLVLGRRLFEHAPQPRTWREWPLGHSDLQTDPTGGYARTWQDIARSCGGA